MTAAESARSRFVLCAVDDVAEGSALQVEVADLVLAVYNVAGTFHVTEDQCTHGPGVLSEGYLDGFVVVCDFHGGAFDVRTGEAVGPPCMVPVRTFPAYVEGGEVVLVVGTDAA